MGRWRYMKKRKLEKKFDDNFTWTLMGRVSLTRNCDHAGLDVWVEIMGFRALLNVYDTRHWDDENGKWEVYVKGN